MANTVIGHFSDRDDAVRAVARLLEQRLIDQGSAEIIDQNTQGLSDREDLGDRSNLGDAGSHSFGSRITHSLKRFFGSDEQSRDRDIYAEGIRRGDVLVVVHTETDNDADRIASELEALGSVDTDKRAQYLRQSGFNKFDSATAMPYSRDETQAFRKDYENWEKQSKGTDADTTVIPVIEEDVKIGKREVQRRGVRVISHVTERPIEETVALRDEKIEVERRPGGRTLRKGEELQAFKEGAIEMTERAEEAVVSKEAKVVEEVAVRKRVDQHEETIRETARRQDVEVQESRGDTDRPISPT